MANPNTTAKSKRDAQKNGTKYGCHIELDEGQEPDDCVKDYGDEAGCMYATRHRTREGCRYWMPVKEVTHAD